MIKTKTFKKTDIYDVYDDILRVENNTISLHDLVKDCFGVDVMINPKTDWDENSFFTVSELDRIRTNVVNLAKVADSSMDISSFGNKFTYVEANKLEELMQYIAEYLQRLISILSQPRAGFYYAGQPLFLMSRKVG